MKLVPFWVDDHPRPDGISGELPASVEYLIVGSGLTAMSAATRLHAAGKEVAIVEARELAGGASSINGGMVSPDVKAGVTAVESAYGPKVADEMWESTVRSVELVRSYATRPGIDALTHDGGMAAVGRGKRDLEAFEAQAERYRHRFGVDWRVYGPSEVGEVVGGDHFNVAMFEPEGFGVHPARLSFGLARDLASGGVPLIDHCHVSSLEPSRGGMRATTTKGVVDAREVVLATNGYTTGQPSSKLSRLVVPIGSYIITTEPIGTGAADRIFPGGAMTYTKKRLLNYMRRTHDNRILLGGRRSLHTDLDLHQSAADLRRALVTFWPELEDVEISHVWGGKLGIPFDLIPHIGKVDGAWYALGYAGHGVGLSCQLGYELAGMLLDEDPPSVYSKTKHDGRFYYSGKRAWFLTPASVLYRTLDRFGL